MIYKSDRSDHRSTIKEIAFLCTEKENLQTERRKRGGTEPATSFDVGITKAEGNAQKGAEGQEQAQEQAQEGHDHGRV